PACHRRRAHRHDYLDAREGGLMATVDELIQDAQKRMDSSVDHTRTEFNTVRTGRASAALLDRVQIDYYGQATPLKQLDTINVRRDAVHHLKELKDVGSDDERRAEESVQKLTDEHTKTIDDLLRHKEAEIMEV